jgi:hypothetical protein
MSPNSGTRERIGGSEHVEPRPTVEARDKASDSTPVKIQDIPVEHPRNLSLNSCEALVKLPMLYFALKVDRLRWKIIDNFEQNLEKMAKVNPRRLKAVASIYAGLMLGSTRKGLIDRVKECGYEGRGEYASKFVNKTLRKLRINLPTDIFREEEAEGNKNQGRPPVRHRLAIQTKDIEESEELESISFLVSLMSGSLARMLKLFIRSSKELGELETAFEEMISILCERRGIPDVQEEEIKNKFREGYENFVKESKEIDVDAIIEEIEWNGQKLGAIRKEAYKYVRLIAEASGWVVDWGQSEADPLCFEWLTEQNLEAKKLDHIGKNARDKIRGCAQSSAQSIPVKVEMIACPSCGKPFYANVLADYAVCANCGMVLRKSEAKPSQESMNVKPPEETEPVK